MLALSETTAATIGVGFGFTWVIASALVGGRLARISAAHGLGIAVPPLMTTNPLKNWRGLWFLYSVSPWRFRDTPAALLIYLVRLSTPLALLFCGIAMFSR